MARKECIVTIPGDAEDNRDSGRSFLIVEMSAMKAEKWATKALLAIMSSDVDLPDGINTNGGMQELARVGIKSLMGLRFDIVEPLLDEMFECCSYLKKPGDTTSKTPLTKENIDFYIEEVSTLLKLRSEIFSLHLGFSLAERMSSSLPGLNKKEEPKETTQNTQTPPSTSAQSYQEEWQQKKS